MADGERQPASLVDQMTRELECPICFEERQLRMLPCQHACCLQCINKIYEKFQEQHDQGESYPRCPTCTQELTKKPEEYSVCVWTECFRENLERLAKALEKDGCQINGCSKDIVKFCNMCDRFLCYYHDRDGGCEGDDDAHVTEDVDKLADESRETLELWKISKQKNISMLTEQRAEIIQRVRSSVDDLHSAKDEQFCEMVEQYAKTMLNDHAKLAQVTNMIEKEQATLTSIADNNIENCRSDVRLITAVKGLNYFESTQKRDLGEMQEILTGRFCYDVKRINDDRIVVGIDGGLLILNCKTGETVQQIDIGHHVWAFDIHGDNLILGVTDEDRTDTELVQLDHEYQEVKRWKTKKVGLDLTVANGRVYLTAMGSDEKDIMVYDVETCAELPDILRNGVTTGLTTSCSGSIVAADFEYNSIAKYRLQGTGNRWTIAWSTKITKPWAVHVDDDGLIWIRSNINDCITILTRKGKVIQEITDERITRLGKVFGLCVYRDRLWLSYERGLVSFDLKLA